MRKEHRAQLAQFYEQGIKVEKFETKATRELIKAYNIARKGVMRDINKAIKRDLNHPSRIRLQRLLKEIDGMLKALTAHLSELSAAAIGQAGEYSYKDTNRILSWGSRVSGYDNVSMSSEQIAAMVSNETLGGHTLKFWLWDTMTTEKAALKAEINAAKVRGVGYKKIMSELGSRYDNLLGSKHTKKNLETVVRSYIQSVNAKAHKDIYEKNAKVIKEVEWTAALENGNVRTGRGTCPVCQARDGSRYPSVAQGPTIPSHQNCRCQYVPVTKTWKELGLDDMEEMDEVYRKWYIRSPARKIVERGERNGDFAQWWKTRGKEFQDNAVGPVRANLIRAGELSFGDIVYKKSNRLIPLNQLKVSKEALTQARRRL